MIPDDILRDAIERCDRERSLDMYPLAEPLPAQRAIVDAAIRTARRHGLRLPPRFTVRWVAAGKRTQGQTLLLSGKIEVVLNVDASPRDLELAALHELQHVADLSARLRVDRMELERRAIAFVARAVGWDR